VSPVSDEEKTDCAIVLSEVYLYLDLECSDARRNLIRKHLDECTDCLHEYGIEHEVKALVARCCGDETAPRSCGNDCGTSSTTGSSRWSRARASLKRITASSCRRVMR